MLPKAYKQLREITTRLERHYKDVQDFEFTIQDERLFMLQTRSGKRTGYAAVMIATDLAAEKLVTPKEAILLVDPEALNQLLAPGFDPDEWKKIPTVTTGLPASPGAASGHVVFSAETAVEWSQQGKPVILVRRETVPDDIHGMFVSQGILTATGGMTSHAAVVGRQMGKPSIVGAGALDINESAKQFSVGGQTVKEGDFISFDGLTGEVKIARVASKPSEILQVVAGTLPAKKSDDLSAVRTAADVGRQVPPSRRSRQRRPARSGGAGLRVRRARHRLVPDRAHVLRRGPDSDRAAHDSRGQRSGSAQGARRAAAAAARGLLRRLQGDARHPVTIRTIDPPLHEFLPKREELMVEIARPGSNQGKGGARRSTDEDGHAAGSASSSSTSSTRCSAIAASASASPIRKSPRCRRAPSSRRRAGSNKEGTKVVPEIMIPLVGHGEGAARSEGDRRSRRRRDDEGAGRQDQVSRRHDDRSAARRADRRQDRRDAQFFSFGTNDLTQLTFGFSRDDVGKFLKIYLEKKILEKDPFASIDTEGVGALVRTGVELGRKTRPDLKIGICGEHGGDPSSVHFFHQVGLDYVSASPYRVPVARLAAAQAALSVKVGD